MPVLANDPLANCATVGAFNTKDAPVMPALVGAFCRRLLALSDCPEYVRVMPVLVGEPLVHAAPGSEIAAEDTSVMLALVGGLPPGPTSKNCQH